MPALGTRLTDEKDVMMVYVPPTTFDPSWKFMMGSTEQQVEESFQLAIQDNAEEKKEWYSDQMPQHEVIIAHGLWLDLTPVTNAMYAEFVGDGGYQNPQLWMKAGWEWVQSNSRTGAYDWVGFTDPQQPRVGVTWYEADAYCKWRGGRLPTEAEWEWAARGTAGSIYPWGNEFNGDMVIWHKNSGSKTAEVGKEIRTEGASWVGALDMSGNVSEWCSSLYEPYPYDADDGREGNRINDFHGLVMRGGSWWSDTTPKLRATCRFWDYSEFASSADGFRCARALA